MARRRSSVGMDSRARILVLRARGVTRGEVAAEVGVSIRSVGQARQDMGTDRWDAALDDLRGRIADGAQERGLFLRARQLAAGADPIRAAAEDSTEEPLAWADIQRAGRDLFRSRALNSRDQERRRLQNLASRAYWAEARVKAAEFLGVEPDQLDGHPQLLKAALFALRGVRA